MKSPDLYRILVVCIGNICRSPVAEEMLRAKLNPFGTFHVDSAGLSAPIGVRPDSLAKATAADLGYVLSPTQHSKPVAGSVVDAAALILVMERRHRLTLCERYPQAVRKTFLLGHWGQGEIKDPIGQNREFFTQVAAQLSSATDAWCERLKQLNGSAAAKSLRPLEQRVE